MRRIVLDTNCLLQALPTRSPYHKIWTDVLAGFQEIYVHFSLIEADPDDNKFVDCAVAADAEYIVTNDSHFNVLKKIDWPKISIITIEDFASQIANGSRVQQI